MFGFRFSLHIHSTKTTLILSLVEECNINDNGTNDEM